jgi:gamma-glutamyl-gamma-aminobutyrate hydrolase PuuD
MKQVLAVCGSSEHFSSDASQPYVEALRGAGIEPILISPGDPIPNQFPGLLLMGGSDVNPALYGEVRKSDTESSDDARDALELELIRKTLNRDLPLLAICRGLQILNVQHGGSLIQHLDSSDRHRVRTPDRGLPAHPVEIDAGTRLARIVGEPLRLEVNSRHHQAIARLGAGLRASAHELEDGTIEAVERPDKRFVVGVQWHPENMSPSDTREAKLFRAFAEALPLSPGTTREH